MIFLIRVFCLEEYANAALVQVLEIEVFVMQRHMWGSLLSEDGVWGAFGCHPHMASEYSDDIEDDLVHALDHPSVVALGEIGLDYSYK